mgnify:CR=1 FL=1
MEEHFEGYNNSVKFVMRSYSEGKIDGGKIYGPLSSLITVDSKYVTAIETALGAAIQNIVVDEERTARAAINCLKRNNAGRATFFPLTSVRAAAEPTREMKQAASFAGTGAIEKFEEVAAMYRAKKDAEKKDDPSKKKRKIKENSVDLFYGIFTLFLLLWGAG